VAKRGETEECDLDETEMGQVGFGNLEQGKGGEQKTIPIEIERTQKMKEVELSGMEMERVILQIDPVVPIDTNNFVNEYHSRSRLHHLSTWKQAFREELASEVAKNRESQTTGQSNSESRSTRSIVHIDFDAFFASVAARYDSSLLSVPFAVCHSAAPKPNSTSEIACASYEARAYGVRNGMFVGQVVFRIL
jgi:hypothetical protein